MHIPPILIAVLIAVLCYVVSQAAFHFFSRRTVMQGRLNEIKRSNRLSSFAEDGISLDKESTDSSQVPQLTLDPNFSPLAETLYALLRGFGINVEKYRREHSLEYYRAGFLSTNHPIYFLAYRFFLGPPMALLGLYILFYAQANDTTDSLLNFILGGLFTIGGLFGATLLLANNRKKREKKLVNQFPDSLDLLLVCVETGLALDGALARVTRELGRTAPEITEELNRTRLELSLLNDRQQALLNLASRTNLAPFKTLVGALLQSERMGTSLTDTLRVLSEDYRMRRLMDAETRAGRLPAIITIPLVCFMLPSLFLIILGPAIISIMNVKK